MRLASLSGRAATVLRSAVIAAALLLATAFSAPAAPESGPGSSGDPIWVAYLTQIGFPGQSYSSALTRLLTTRLSEKFACTDIMSSSDLGDLLGLARDQQLLGTPEDQQVNLLNLAAAMGKTGTLVFGSFGKTGNTYFVNIKAANMKTAKVTSNQMFTATGDSDSVLVDLIERAAAGSDLKPCRPRWTGTISVRDETDDFFVKKVGVTTTMLMNRKRDDATVSLANDFVSSPDGLSASGSLAHESKWVGYDLEEGVTDCAPEGWHNIRGHVPQNVPDRTEKLTRNTSAGQWSGNMDARVTIDRAGHYTISWSAPEQTTDDEVYISTTRSPDVCKGAAAVTKEATNKRSTSLIWPVTTIEGDVDPSKLDTLSGRKEVSTPLASDYPDARKTGSRTLTVVWNLSRAGSR